MRDLKVMPFLALAVALVAGFWLKSLCTTHVWDGYQYRTTCYSDIYALWGRPDQKGHSLSKKDFPYLSTPFEYPAGTGLFVGAMAKVTNDGPGFLRANALGLALFAFAGLAALAPIASDRRRLLYYALAPSMVLYAFHNWDLLAVGFSAAALYAFWRRWDLASGIALGLGAAAKLYPGFLLLPLGLARWTETRDRGRARRGRPPPPAHGGRVPWTLVAGSALGFAAPNLPVLLASPQGWLFPWRFQLIRPPNRDDVWSFLTSSSSSSGRFMDVVAFVLFVALAALLARAELSRERFRPYALGFGIVLAFLITSKVFSPQYALWLIPFFVVVGIPWYGFAAFAVTEASVWIAVAHFLTWCQFHGACGGPRLNVLGVTVFARHAVLVWLLWLSRRVGEPVAPSPAR